MDNHDHLMGKPKRNTLTPILPNVDHMTFIIHTPKSPKAVEMHSGLSPAACKEIAFHTVARILNSKQYKILENSKTLITGKQGKGEDEGRL